MGAREDVDAVDLVQAQPIQQPQQPASADRARRPRPGQALRRQSDAPGGGKGECRRHSFSPLAFPASPPP